MWYSDNSGNVINLKLVNYYRGYYTGDGAKRVEVVFSNGEVLQLHTRFDDFEMIVKHYCCFI